MASAEAKISTDHEEIRHWAEARGGQPACVKGTGEAGDVGMLRIDFPGFSGEESLQHISWDDWFEKFDERKLALLHQEMTAGGAESNFNKLVSRPAEAAVKTSRPRKAAKKATAKKAAVKKTAVKKTPVKKKVAVKKKAAAKKAVKKAVKKAPKKAVKKATKKAVKKAAKKAPAKRRR